MYYANHCTLLPSTFLVEGTGGMRACPVSTKCKVFLPATVLAHWVGGFSLKTRQSHRLWLPWQTMKRDWVFVKGDGIGFIASLCCEFAANIFEAVLVLITEVLLSYEFCLGCVSFHKIMGLRLFFKAIVKFTKSRLNPVLFDRKETMNLSCLVVTSKPPIG